MRAMADFPRLIGFALAALSAGAMLYVGLYQSRAIKRLWCPLFDNGCEAVADAPLARLFVVPDGYLGAVLYATLALLLLAPASVFWVWALMLALAALATIANVVGIWSMTRLGSFCFYCLLTALSSPVLLWAVWTTR